MKGDVHLSTGSHGFLCSDCAKENAVWHPVSMDSLYVLHDLREGGEGKPSGDLGSDELDDLFKRCDDILTVLIQVFLQHNLKTAKAARMVRDIPVIKAEAANDDIKDVPPEPM